MGTLFSARHWSTSCAFLFQGSFPTRLGDKMVVLISHSCRACQREFVLGIPIYRNVLLNYNLCSPAYRDDNTSTSVLVVLQFFFQNLFYSVSNILCSKGNWDSGDLPSTITQSALLDRSWGTAGQFCSSDFQRHV
jgi:hypothetical protein